MLGARAGASEGVSGCALPSGACTMELGATAGITVGACTARMLSNAAEFGAGAILGGVKIEAAGPRAGGCVLLSGTCTVRLGARAGATSGLTYNLALVPGAIARAS